MSAPQHLREIMQNPTTIQTMLLNSSFLSLPSFFKSQELGRTNLLNHRNGSPLLRYATIANVSQRKSANYQPNIWNYDILQSLKHDYAVIFLFFLQYIYVFFTVYM